MSDTSSANQDQQDENGSFIPASQRPDGTWRKARRVKEGYVPQEEVPLYESKGKKIMNKQMQPVKVDGYIAHQTIPGLFIEDKPAKKEKKERKKAAKTEQVTKALAKVNINSENNEKSASDAGTDPTKKLKNLKKRLREVEALELKIQNGQVVKPEPDQLAKVGRKTELILQIDELEKQLQ